MKSDNTIPGITVWQYTIHDRSSLAEPSEIVDSIMTMMISYKLYDDDDDIMAF